MTYTQYFYRQTDISEDDFKRIAEDFRKLIPVLKDMGIKLGNQIGKEEPVITNELIAFNGSQNCGHPKGYYQIGGKKRRCHGDCSYETLFFPRVLVPPKFLRPNGNKYYCFCKTGRKPYDLAVQVFLIISKQVLNDQIRVSSDGDSKDWEEARRLCQKHLGYGLNFKLDI